MDRVYKYPAQLAIGDLLIDIKTKEKMAVRDISVYTTVSKTSGEPYKRSSWVQVGSAVYSPDVLFKKFRNNEMKQLEVAGSVFQT